MNRGHSRYSSAWCGVSPELEGNRIAPAGYTGRGYFLSGIFNLQGLALFDNGLYNLIYRRRR
jgi:hypothetical protein